MGLFHVEHNGRDGLKEQEGEDYSRLRITSCEPGCALS